MKTKTLNKLLLTMLSFSLLFSCSTKEESIKVKYLREGKIAEMTIPLSFIKNETELNSQNIDHIKCSTLDSTMYVNNNPDKKIRFKTTLKDYYLCKLLLDNEKQVYKIHAHF